MDSCNFFSDGCNPQCLAMFMVIVCVIAICELVLKGFALWKAARNNQGVWFVCILFLNTLCILPIIYLLLNKSKKE